MTGWYARADQRLGHSLRRTSGGTVQTQTRRHTAWLCVTNVIRARTHTHTRPNVMASALRYHRVRDGQGRWDGRSSLEGLAPQARATSSNSTPIDAETHEEEVCQVLDFARSGGWLLRISVAVAVVAACRGCCSCRSLSVGVLVTRCSPRWLYLDRLPKFFDGRPLYFHALLMIAVEDNASLVRYIEYLEHEGAPRDAQGEVGAFHPPALPEGARCCPGRGKVVCRRATGWPRRGSS